MQKAINVGGANTAYGQLSVRFFPEIGTRECLSVAQVKCALEVSPLNFFFFASGRARAWLRYRVEDTDVHVPAQRIIKICIRARVRSPQLQTNAT